MQTAPRLRLQSWGAAAAAAKEKAERQAQSWTGWLLGGGKQQQAKPEDTELRADLGEEEQQFLENMVNEQEAAMQGCAAAWLGVTDRAWQMQNS